MYTCIRNIWVSSLSLPSTSYNFCKILLVYNFRNHVTHTSVTTYSYVCIHMYYTVDVYVKVGYLVIISECLEHCFIAYKIYFNVATSATRLICYSYITSTSRISLLLHKTEGEAGGQVLITMISYKCL